jgi:putative SOS response-associated peptidase YedK
MCGRVRLSSDYSETKIAVKFDAAYPAPNIRPSWNVCPTDSMLVAVRSADGKRIPQQMRWGLIPWWAKDTKIGFSSINARAETVDTTPAFRDAWKKASGASSSRMASTNGRIRRNSPMPSRWPLAATW